MPVERRLERNWSVTPLPSRKRKPAADAANFIFARDERTFCVAEQAWSQGKGGDHQACGAKKNVRWSRRSKNSMEQHKHPPHDGLSRGDCGNARGRLYEAFVLQRGRARAGAEFW